MGLIPDEVIDEVLARTDIVELISPRVPLRRSGANFKALCPFHREKTPSFMVSPSKQIWHCFGCGMGGGVVNFLMKYENLEFPEAVRMLAQKVGVRIPETREISPGAKSKRKSLYEINELAAKYFQKNLEDPKEGRPAREYLKQRAIEDETCHRFRLGYAPHRWDGFFNYAKREGISCDFLVQAGLILPGKEGNYYDRFRNKLIFPICDFQGRVIGFGSRVLDQTLPKYINSPETDIFRKGRNLYGLNLAREYARDHTYVIVVEGYMDCITLYQNGFKSVVASLGTALTADHVRLLKRFTNTVCMVYDSDQAGEAASLRGLDLVVAEDLRCKIVTLPRGFDPDDYLRRKGRESFQDQLDRALDLFDYKLNLLTSKYDSSKVEDIAKITAEMLPTIARMTNAVLRSGYIKELSKRLAVDVEALIIELRRLKDRGATYYQPEIKESPSPMSSVEKTLIRLMLEDKDVGLKVKDSLEVEDFRDSRAKRIVQALFKSISEQKSIDPAHLMSHMDGDEISQMISGLLVGPDELMNRKKVADDCIERIREANLKHRRLALQRKIRLAEAAGDDAQRMELLAEFQKLIGGSKEKL